MAKTLGIVGWSPIVGVTHGEAEGTIEFRVSGGNLRCLNPICSRISGRGRGSNKNSPSFHSRRAAGMNNLIIHSANLCMMIDA